MIYFMQSVDGGPVKIGYSADVDARRKALENHYGCALAVLAVMPGDLDTEAEVHARFEHLRLSGGKTGRRTEQFQPGPDLMAFIGRPLLVGANPETVEAMPKREGSRRTVLTFRGSEEFDDWLRGLADDQRLAPTVLIDLALVAYAKQVGYDKPAPKR